MFDLNHKTALITGAASGIGKAIASVLAARGARVIIFDLNEEAALETAEEITASGGNCRSVAADVTDLDQIKSLLATIETESPVEILINNAGIGHIGTAENTTPDFFDRVYTINVKGYYHMIHAVLPYMIQRATGVILNIASVAGTVGISERFAYSISKGAVLAMTRSVAKDFIGLGIRCNSISPGRVHTPFVDGYLAKNYPGREAEMFARLEKTQPLGRMGRPAEIAYLALYLCSEESAFVTGTDFPIDGGFITLNS